ncbi:MAG: hypothetical protein J7M25_13640, partial [Deltaproteobacteria bacterium]|nr:hypothetical protein [Deltaproteobacteria bacterium]
MKMGRVKRWLPLVGLLSGTMGGGCWWSAPVRYEDMRRPAEPVRWVEVPERPPQSIAESVPEAPYPGAVWVPGFWNWTGARWGWVSGRYEQPRYGAYWVAPRYRHWQGRWVYRPGHWSRRRRGWSYPGGRRRRHRYGSQDRPGRTPAGYDRPGRLPSGRTRIPGGLPGRSGTGRLPSGRTRIPGGLPGRSGTGRLPSGRTR